MNRRHASGAPGETFGSKLTAQERCALRRALRAASQPDAGARPRRASVCVERVRAEYREMPGQCLSLAQAVSREFGGGARERGLASTRYGETPSAKNDGI
jgi:hypothetical protein